MGDWPVSGTCDGSILTHQLFSVSAYRNPNYLKGFVIEAGFTNGGQLKIQPGAWRRE